MSPANHVAVRPARAEEYEAIAALTVAAYAEYQPLLTAEQWDEYRSDLADIAGRAQRGTVFVAEDAGGALSGVVTYYRHVADGPDGPRGDWWWWPADYGYIRALAVDPAARGRGVGRALMEACFSEARATGAAGVALNTTPAMSAAKSLYERLGFRMLPPAEGHLDYGGFHFFSYVLDLSIIPPA
ncbi:MAG TPA: GNAT family N-acetyltransferase [Actinomycetota bacterium]|nr:GNAT family N-acetyltransferase [Actinomycetota bacterium]